MTSSVNGKGESIFVTAQDGLKLHARHYGARTAPGLPVVCLPGLSRTEADFEELAETLAADSARPRRVVALDYRGRGLSEFDRDPANYNFAVELADVVSRAHRARDRTRGICRQLAGRHPHDAAWSRASDRDRGRGPQ